jgi:hypothetical protein
MRNAIIDWCFRAFKEIGRVPACAGRDVLGVRWEQPDSLPFGTLGQAFFLLELYGSTYDEEVKQALDATIASLEEHDANTHTYNYSLFHGRGGLLYFYVELYRRMGNERFLDNALRLSRIYTGGPARLFTLSGDPGLYRGSAGLALALLHLYAESGDKSLLANLEELAGSLLAGARLSGNGIGWDKLTEHGRWGRGFSYGASGCAFLFLELGKFFRNDAFFHLADRMIDPDAGNPECALFDRVGIDCVTCYSAQLQNRIPVFDIGLEQELLEASNDSSLSAGLYFGRAGLGLLCFEASRLASDTRPAQMAHAFAEALLARPATATGRGTALAGCAGEGYFLLRLLNTTDASSLLFPRVSPPKKAPPIQIGFDSIFLSGSRELYAPMLRRQFPFSYGHLEKEMDAQFPAPGKDTLPTPEEWIDRLCKAPGQTGLRNDSEWNKLLDKDRFLLRAQRHFEALPLAVDPDWQAITRNLLRDDLDSLSFVWTPDLQLYHPGPRPVLNGTWDIPDITALFMDHGADSFICARTPANGVKLVPLGRDLLAFDLFAVPASVNDAAEQLTVFIYAQDELVQQVVQVYLDADGPAQLAHAIRAMIRRVACHYYMEGFLVAAPLPVTNEELHCAHTITHK